MKKFVNLKRVIPLFALMVLLGNTAAYAKLEPTGPFMEIYKSWLQTYQSDTLVGNILNGNVAFVANSTRAWVEDEVLEMDKAAVYNDDNTFSIPSSVAQSVFGVSSLNDYVSSAAIVQQTGKNVFCDPRGFIVFSDKPRVVNTTFPGSPYSQYVDYYTISDCIGYITWEDVEFTEEERMDYIRNWQQSLTIPEGTQEENRVAVDKMVKSAAAIQESINIDAENPDSITVFEVNGPFSSANLYGKSTDNLSTLKNTMNTAYNNIYTMAKGYFAGGRTDTQLRDDILKCIKFMNNYYRLTWDIYAESRNEWTATQFQIPIRWGNTLALMYDDMTDEERKECTDLIFDKSPIPNLRTAAQQYTHESYTNRIWRTFGFFNAAVIANDTYRMNYAMKYSNQAFEYTYKNSIYAESMRPSPDGFYKDGSMVFHNKFPYNLGYGNSYISFMADFVNLTEGTKFDLNKIYGYNNIYSFIGDSIIPFGVNGLTMAMVKGRESVIGMEGMYRSCAVVTNHAPEEIRKRVTNKIMSHIGGRDIQGNGESYEMSSVCSAELVKEFNDYAKSLGADFNAEENVSNVYYNMDRVLHRRDNFTAGLAMSSTRIGKYESYPPQNSTGWYGGDGMLSIYLKDDVDNFSGTWFNKANPYYMPGTTVDSTQRKILNTQTDAEWSSKKPDNDWAGGVSDGKNSVAGMIMGNDCVSGLDGKKSYFMFGDKIICLGSGITGGSGEVYTVIENRLIKETDPDNETKDIEYTAEEISTNDEVAYGDSVKLSVDKNTSTSLPIAEIGEWVCYDFGKRVEIGTVGLALLYGDLRKTSIEFQASDDGENFTAVLEWTSRGDTIDIEFLDIDFKGRYMRLVNKGNSAGTKWMNISEIQFFDASASREEIEESAVIITTGYDDFYIDGELTDVNFNQACLYNDSKWAYLDKKMGYVFLQPNSRLKLERARQASSPTFLQLSLEHGINPEKESYAYMMMPGAAFEETKSMAESDSVEVLYNDEKIQAVYDKTNNIIGANIYSKNAVLDGILFETPCSVLINRNDNVIFVSDPTLKQNLVTLKVPEDMMISQSKYVSAEERTVNINMNYKHGSSFEIKYKNKNDENEKVRTMNYNLRTAGSSIIRTRLCAIADDGSDVSFNIKEAPKNAEAEIIGNILYYYAKGSFSDTITVTAKTASGDMADFKININKEE